MAVATPRRGARRNEGERLRLEPPSGLERKRHLSWILVGLVVMLAAGVGGAMLVAQAGDRQPVLALAEPVERGEVLAPEHLRTVEVATDEQVSLVPAESRFDIVGRVAAGPLPAGTLITEEHFVEGPLLPDGFRVVGLSLEPGAYPVSTLRPGDRVAVVRTSDPADGAGDIVVLAEAGEVFAVEPLGEATRTLMVSVAVPADVAPAVAVASAQRRVSLVLLEAP